MRIGVRREGEQPGDADGAEIDVAAVRPRSGGAREREERSRAARRIDDALALRRREHLHDEVDDVAGREELAFVRLGHARDERLEHRVERALLEERAREQLVDAREQRVARVRHGIDVEDRVPARGLRDRAAQRHLPRDGDPRGGDGEDDLEGVLAARRDDHLLHVAEDARGAHAGTVALRHRAEPTRRCSKRRAKCQGRAPAAGRSGLRAPIPLKISHKVRVCPESVRSRPASRVRLRARAFVCARGLDVRSVALT